ncbi:MAG: 2-hydroxyacid dehydrogenase [Gammaproteobacteria bacterium]|nr:2-hydroxyacid dehydrogenase [Gammaproteobacteria bacterium]
MSFSKAVFLDFLSVHPDDLDVTCLHEVVDSWHFCDNTKSDDVAATIADADVVVVNKVILNKQNLSIAKNLKLICAAATGVNNIDLDATAKFGISVCNVRRYATPAVVQHVFALLLSLTTRFEQYQGDVYNGNWAKSEFFCLLDYPIRELQGLILGIIGYGELGQAVAKIAESFGMKVLLAKRDENDSRDNRIALHELLPKVDVLSLHCPLTQSTRGLIGEKELALMRSDAILINTSRGGLVDEKALLDALQKNRLGGAGLDVLAQEPPPENYFLLQQKLPNLIITPHTAWASREARQRLIDEIAKNIQAYQQGQPRNIV